MRVRTDRLSLAQRALVIWRSTWRVSSCNNPVRFVGRSGQTERRSNELNWRPYMTKAGSPVSDETKEPGLLVRAASQPTSRCNRAQQSPADPQLPPCNTMLSEHRDLGAAELATQRNGPRSQTKSIRDTATLVIDGRAFLVAGIEGVGGAPLNSLKDFVEAAGGTVTCVPAPGISTYTCHLPDGSDLATIALLNGAARLGSDAPAADRMQEEIARTNHRGIWASYRQSSDRDLAACSSVRPLPPFGGVSPRPLATPQQVFAYRPNPR